MSDSQSIKSKHNTILFKVTNFIYDRIKYTNCNQNKKHIWQHIIFKTSSIIFVRMVIRVLQRLSSWQGNRDSTKMTLTRDILNHFKRKKYLFDERYTQNRWSSSNFTNKEIWQYKRARERKIVHAYGNLIWTVRKT